MYKKFLVASLVALLLLLLAKPALADSIDYDSGNFQSGSLAGSFSSSIDFSVTGSLNRIVIDTGKLVSVACPAGAGMMACYDFSGGSVSVDGKLFQDSLTGGLTIKQTGVVSINASLMKEVGVASGAVVGTFTFGPGNQVTDGSANVSINSTTVTAEPATLGIMATGLFGIGTLARRRLRKNAE
jgi:hypothetical protein